MRWTPDVARGAWIAPRLGRWGSVTGTMPGGFDAYVRVREPEGQLTPDGLAALAGLLRPATTTPDDLTLAVWVGWGELHPDNGSVFGWFGDVSEAERRRAQRRLRARFNRARRAAVGTDIVGALTDPGSPHLLNLPHREYVLLAGTLAELADATWPYRAGIGWHREFDLTGPLPQLVWPADHAWCLGSEVDVGFTVVGGSRSLVSTVLAAPGFVTEETTADAELATPAWPAD